MSARGRSQRRHDRMRGAVEEPALHEALEQVTVPLPDDALEWLARICRLEGVPFEALVPDAAMLPPESIRFFHVDQNWLDAMVDGALSVANVGGDEQAMLRGLRPRLSANLERAPGAVEEGDASPAVAWSGFLLRSAVVADFPGLRAVAYPDAEGSQPALETLRLEALAGSILIGIFAGVAQRIEISKPAQILHFGVEPKGEEGPPFEVHLRGVGVGDWPLGEEIEVGEKPVGVEIATRAAAGSGPEVLDVKATAAAAEAKLGELVGQKVTLTPATLGVQLVQGTECAVYLPKKSSPRGEGETADAA